jgi:hypothetical protein
LDFGLKNQKLIVSAIALATADDSRFWILDFGFTPLTFSPLTRLSHVSHRIRHSLGEGGRLTIEKTIPM